MKIYVVAAMHGDEVFGLKIVSRLQRKKAHNIRTRVGHPAAVAKNVRYLETDLNRSFQTKNTSIESALARTICDDIENFKPDYIIDIHTSVSNVKKVAIIANLTEEIHILAQALGMEAVVVMPKTIAKHSLIGCYPDSSISIEFGKFQRSDKLAAFIADKIDSLTVPVLNKSSCIPAFRVVETIPKGFKDLKGIPNLRFNQELKGYPFLAGEDTYENIGGFLAIRAD